MTKYVLNSGGLRNEPEKAKKFLVEVLSGLGDNPRILMCHFAQPREEWEEKFRELQKTFDRWYSENIEATTELALPESFQKQIEGADALYLHGGDNDLVRDLLRQFDIPRIWDGKVVATNSASSHALAKHFWSCDSRRLSDGLGILPIKFLAHYQSEYGSDDPRGPIDWERALEILKNYGDTSLPVHALKEGDFVVINT